MYARMRFVVCALSLLALIVPDAEASRRRRRSYTTQTFTTTAATSTTYASVIKQIAPKIVKGTESLRVLDVAYSYNQAIKPEVAFKDQLRVFLRIRDPKILAAAGDLVAEVRITDLSDYRHSTVKYLPVSVNLDSEDEYKLASFDIVNESGESQVAPTRVYRLFVNLHRQAEQYDATTALGRIAAPYYVATSGPSQLDQARHRIVMRTFKEFYYRNRGWRSKEQYPMDCYSYYMWATGVCTVGAENGRTVLNRLFGGRIPFVNGNQIPKLSGQEPIHADYVRKPGHSFMLLAYDPNQKHVWTMEGNFNSTVEVVIRSVDSGWTVGHLEAGHIRPDFQ